MGDWKVGKWEFHFEMFSYPQPRTWIYLTATVFNNWNSLEPST